MLQTICYVSNCNTGVTNKELQKLFRTSKKDNYELKISGILIYDKGNFFQIIEGQKKNISKLYKKINNDQRHHHIIEIINQSINERLFKDYDIEFSIIDNDEKERKLKNYLNWLKNAELKSVNKIVNVIENFILIKSRDSAIIDTKSTA